MEVEALLDSLIHSLKSALEPLTGHLAPLLLAALHDTEILPDKNVSEKASEALDLLSEIRLFLEPGHLVLADHFLGYMDTKCLVTAVELHISDILQSSGPQTTASLAVASKANPSRLRQIMRTLRNKGIFTYNRSTETYSNNHVSTLLLTSHWTQWHNWVELYGNEFYDMARGLPEACRQGTGRTAAQVNYSTDDSMFKYFTDRGWVGKLHRTLSGGAIAQAPGILADYPWEEVADMEVLDVGGGGGGLMALLLRKYENMRGAILDLDKVIGQAKANFHGEGGEYADVGNRIPEGNLIAGDFMESVPSFEVYTMKWTLHDWDDEKSGVILRNVRRAIKRGLRSRLVILESVLKDGYVGRMSRYGDLNMMVAVGGQERDESQWRTLASENGWELRKIYQLRNAWPCAIELLPVWGTGQTSYQQVVAEMRFLEPWDSAQGNPYIRVAPEEGFDRMNFKWVDYPVVINDARPSMQDFNLDINGFAYYSDPVDDSLIQALRGNEKDHVINVYYPHVEELVKKTTGAKRVIIFDHTQRKRRLALSESENDDGKEQPATMVHCDQSEAGALRRLKMNLSADENLDDILKNRVQMLNVWRPLTEPVQDWPLATMEFQSAQASDMHQVDLLRGSWESRGQTATFTHAERQKWYFLERQRSHEVTMIKIWDNEKGVSNFCAHSAFHHPDAPQDAQPRESVEVRCLVFYEDERVNLKRSS